MFEQWKLKDFVPGEGIGAGVLADDFDSGEWADISAPGDVHRAIMDAGWIEDPYYDQNEEKVAWMEEKEWWYRTQFEVDGGALQDGERLQLIFHGLDTFVTIYLNGEEIGSHKNMFRPADFDISELVRFDAANTLALCFDPPVQHVPESDMPMWGRNTERVFMRKAQFGFGWDWGPRLPTIGIWRPVELVRQQNAALTGVHFHTVSITPDQSKAIVAIDVAAEALVEDGGPLGALITLTAPDGRGKAQYKLPLVDGQDVAFLTIKQPALWWTNDLGDAALYGLTVDLLAGESVVDTYEAHVGIRTIELDQSVDVEEPGTRFFRFVLNGVPIFAKGANWIPADSFVGTIPDDLYTKLLTLSREANMNMLRIWGGGIYEHDIFYELCNELGILVWQDFMFSCAPYPEDDAMAAEVDAEARYQVKRLRNHPSMALWCGNNENQWLHERHNWNNDTALNVPGNRYYDDILPSVVAELDGVVPYWPGSPYGGDDFNSEADGDRHNWNVWHGNFDRVFGEALRGDTGPEGVSYYRYAEDMGRFISEFGMHAAPVLETLKTVIPEDQLFHHSPSMDHHNKDNPKNKGDNLMIASTGLPENLEDYIDFSMIAQAEGLKFGIEHFRRRKPHCSGTLFWQLNDCWPVLSWSVLDYYGVGKAGYFYSQRFFAPVLASFKPVDGGLELWLTNDTLQDITDTAVVKLATFAGEIQLEQVIEVFVPSNASVMVAAWDETMLVGGPDRYVSVRSEGNVFPANRHFFVPIKALQREAAPPQISIMPIDDHELHVTLSASVYCFFVNFAVPDDHTRFSDNYFDLEPGETRVIVITNDRIALTPEMVSVRWR